jgi:hypothetical protein
MFSWEFFRRHTGRGIPSAEWGPGGLLCRDVSGDPAFSLIPWLYMIPARYQNEMLRHMTKYFTTLPMDQWHEPDEKKFQFQAYKALIGLIQQKMLAQEWPKEGR